MIQVGESVFYILKEIPKKKIKDLYLNYKTLDVDTWWSFLLGPTVSMEDVEIAKHGDNNNSVFLIQTKHIGTVIPEAAYIKDSNKNLKKKNTGVNIISGLSNPQLLVRWDFRKSPDLLLPGESYTYTAAISETSVLSLSKITIMTRQEVIDEIAESLK